MKKRGRTYVHTYVFYILIFTFILNKATTFKGNEILW